MFAMRLPTATLATLHAEAERDGRTASALALRLIQRGLAQIVASATATATEAASLTPTATTALGEVAAV